MSEDKHLQSTHLDLNWQTSHLLTLFQEDKRERDKSIAAVLEAITRRAVNLPSLPRYSYCSLDSSDLREVEWRKLLKHMVDEGWFD